MMRSMRLGAAAIICAFALSAQTLEHAEAAWKARQWAEANDEFLALAAKFPGNADIKVRWGRMLLEHAQASDVEYAAKLFNEALAIRKDHPGALLGLALIAADNFENRAAELATRALAADPKLVEAQELLARLALEDNNSTKAAAEARKALAIDPHSVEGRAILASIDWLSDKKDSQWDPHDARGYETAAHFFIINRRYEEGIQYYRKALELDPRLDSARSQLGINLMRLGNEEEAYRQLETCFNNGFVDSATKNSLRLMDKYKNFVTYKTDRTILRLDRKEADLLHPYFESEMLRAISTYEKKYRFKLSQPVQVEVVSGPRGFRGAHARAAGTGRAGRDVRVCGGDG